jgi:hypothetical protein
MKEIIAIIVLISLLWLSLVHALDRSIFPGCTVIKQQGNMLLIDPDQELTKDQLQKLIEKINASGYDALIQPSGF